jgi:YHS domain-containing protein
MIMDPVCGMHMDPANAPAMFTYKEHTYYFCCDDHKEMFQDDPQRYIANAGEEYQMGCEQKAA